MPTTINNGLYNLWRLRNSSHVYMFADASYQHYVELLGWNFLEYRHFGSVNAVMADLHVESKKKVEMYYNSLDNYYTPDPSL